MAEEMELAHVKAAASGVIPAPIDTVWSLVRVFSSIGQWLLQDGFMSLHSELMVRQQSHWQQTLLCRLSWHTVTASACFSNEFVWHSRHFWPACLCCLQPHMLAAAVHDQGTPSCSWAPTPHSFIHAATPF